MLDWLRRRAAVPRVPDALWCEVLDEFPFLAARPEPHVQRLRALAEQFLAAKQFHGANGFVITDRVALAIAAQAVLPVLHLQLGLGWYDDFVGIVVHPGEVIARRSATDHDGVVHDYEEVLSGEAMHHGPVMLSWADVASAAGRDDREPYNVVIHEFVHKIDMRDGAADGCPPLPTSAARRHWRSVLQSEFDAFRESVTIADRFGGDRTWLDPYGAESLDEFFAVACEAYFVSRARFETELPRLLTLFDSFFRPAAAS
jgi:MtfA peptidase